jgi:hypothetical protein
MDNKALVLKEEGGEQITLSVDDIKKFIAKNATDKELFVFLNVCRSYNLNPFKREVHFIKYDEKSAGQTIVGYEIYLKRAEATGKLDGWKCWIDGNKAKAIIYRKDRQYPFEWEVDRSEFNKNQSTWKSMPNFMLKKVCIAQAFRLCFPSELGGMPYIPEEAVDTDHKVQDVEPISEPEATPLEITPPEITPPEVTPPEEEESKPSKEYALSMYEDLKPASKASFIVTFGKEKFEKRGLLQQQTIIGWLEQKLADELEG